MCKAEQKHQEQEKNSGYAEEKENDITHKEWDISSSLKNFKSILK